MTTTVGAAPTLPKQAPQPAPGFVSKTLDKAQMAGKAALSLATSPLAVYFTVSTAAIAFGTDSTLLRSAMVNTAAHAAALPAATVYSTFLRSRVLKAAEQAPMMKREPSLR